MSDSPPTVTVMRTQDEIVARIREKRSIFAFDAEVLLPHLDYDHAREFIKPETTREQWEAPREHDGTTFDTYPLTEAAALRDFRAYSEFAWGKAQDHRSLSAGRSVEKLEAWTWLLGRDDVLAEVAKTDYAQYGCPILKVFCEAFGFPIPDDEGTRRMTRGEPCVVGCDMGCGS